MRLDMLAKQLGYTVYATDMLPYERTLEDGTVKRTDMIADERAGVLWVSREAFEALKGATSEGG